MLDKYLGIFKINTWVTILIVNKIIRNTAKQTHLRTLNILT